MKSGAEQLIDWMARRGFTQRQAAEHFDWDETFISKLRSGERLPGLTNAIRIERETGIPVEAWVSSELDEIAASVAPAPVTRSKTKRHTS